MKKALSDSVDRNPLYIRMLSSSHTPWADTYRRSSRRRRGARRRGGRGRLGLCGRRVIDAQVHDVRGTEHNIVVHLLAARHLVLRLPGSGAAAFGAPRAHWRQHFGHVPFSSASVACAASMFDKTPWYRMFECDVSEISAPMNDAAESSCPPADIFGSDGTAQEDADKKIT